MTEQEAIKILKINCICSPKSTEFIKASNVAIKALEKQIPKKPTEKSQMGFDFEVAHSLSCPSCNAPIINVWSKAEYKPKFCHFCGQALDWGDEE